MPNEAPESSASMSSAEPKSVVRRVEQLFLRPLFLFITFVLILFAIVQGTGRFAVATMSLFSDELNTVTRPFGVRVEDIEGSWQGLNPVIRAERILFAGGFVEKVEFELDVLESAYRSALVPRRAKADKVFLDLVETDQGWGLRGAVPGREMPDVLETLRNADEISLTAIVSLTDRDGKTGSAHGQIEARNVGAQHYLDMSIATTAADGLRVRLWERDKSFFGETSSRKITVGGDLVLPEILTGQADISIGELALRWQESNTFGGGNIALQLSRVKIPGEEVELDFAVQAEMSRAGESVRATVASLLVRPNVQTDLVRPNVQTENTPGLDLSGLEIALSLVGVEYGPEIEVWHPQLQLDSVTAFGTAATGPINAPGRWIRGLQTSGLLNNVHMYGELSDKLSVGFAASLADLHIDGYRGAPMLTNGQGQLWGDGQNIAIQMNAGSGQLQFPDLFTDRWDFDFLQGVVKAWIAPGYFAMRGSSLKSRINESQVAGSFSLTRPDPRYEQRVGLMLGIDHTEMAAARTFVPYKIPDELSKWLAEGPQGGELSDITFLYQGQVHVRDRELGRRIELVADMTNASVIYDQAWPEISAVNGQVHVAGRTTHVRVDTGVSKNMRLSRSTVQLRDNGVYADVDLNALGDGRDALRFILESPLTESLGFVTPNWHAGGILDFSGTLRVPIKQEEAPPLAVDFDFDLREFDLSMPEYRLVIEDLVGSGHFSLPHRVIGTFSGALFEHPAEFRVTSDDEWVRFNIQGTSGHTDVYQLIDYEDIGVIDGLLGFDAVLGIAMTETNVTNLELTSDLVGLEMRLPSYLGKEASVASALELDVQFLDAYQSIRWGYLDTQGWLHFGDKIERGAIGVGAAPPTTAQDQQAIAISGTLDTLTLSDWVSEEGEARVALPLDWKIQGLRVDSFVIDDLAFKDLVLGGEQVGDSVGFNFASADLTGRVDIPAEGLMEIDLTHLRLPAAEEPPIESLSFASTVPAIDPIDVEVGYRLPHAKVDLDLLHLDEEPFGSWRFVMRPEDDVVWINNLNADVNGVHISDGELNWDLAEDVSHFEGMVVLDDLAETLPLWDYAPVLETTKASVQVDARWSGSPANVNLVGLNGDLAFTARDGRFLDVEAGGGLRMMSLLNFSNIAKRISLDFTDVTRGGIGFDKINAKVNLNDGEMQFVERMIVEGSSSNFQVGGKVNLNTGLLDNEMIVTLPVSDSLPWYGVYLALANPLAGLGVLVGERVLRKPLRAFSTAKFEVTGTLDEPEVKFLSLWDQSMSEPDQNNTTPLSAIDERAPSTRP
ncbi:MAG: hypothetical protein GKR90_20810 [Pseudomonadales bacterium]|nr:hypothetical protein [Pseudomonadales bacterium]